METGLEFLNEECKLNFLDKEKTLNIWKIVQSLKKFTDDPYMPPPYPMYPTYMPPPPPQPAPPGYYSGI
jgi:hypothetical protein